MWFYGRVSVSLDSGRGTFSAFVFLVGFHGTVHGPAKNRKMHIPIHF